MRFISHKGTKDTKVFIKKIQSIAFVFFVPLCEIFRGIVTDCNRKVIA